MIRTIRAVLLVAHLTLTTSLGVAAQDEEAVTLLPHTSEAFALEAVVPEGWTDLGPGIFARQRDEIDPTLIALQSTPFSAEAMLDSLLPQLALSEPPQSVGTYDTPSLSWTLYEVEVPVAGVTVDLALAEEDGVAYLALLQAPPDEFEALHASVFLPTLDAFAPYELETGPVPYLVEEVTFQSGDHTLAGTLTLPSAPGPHPAIVFVSGSGPQDRDEALGAGIAIRPFRLLADALTRAGVAVLRYDDRGVGQSTGDFSEATSADFAADAEAAITYLLSRPEIDPDQVGLLGHSEGGLIAAMLGARNDDLDFIISLAGPGVPGREVLTLQSRLLMEAEAAGEEAVADQVAFIEELMTLTDDPEAAEALIYERGLEHVQAMQEEERAILGDLEEYARAIAEQTAQQFTGPWFEFFLTYDPAADWAQTDVPVLAIFGGKDTQVDAAQNAPPLAAALLEGGNTDVQIVVLPDANHLFQAAETGAFSEYATLPAEFTPDLIPTILGWLERHQAEKGSATATTMATPVAATPVA
jgi:pimeloyl-ACP methyl ester carboxylesterase